MSDEPDSLVLRYLRRIDERTERLENDMKDVKARLTSVEEQVALLRTDVIHVHHRLDRMDERLTRVEKRLDLINA